jgi:hypothetical protein
VPTRKSQSRSILADENSGRFPSEDVAAVLREELVGSEIELKSILYAALMPEVKQTTRLMLDGLEELPRWKRGTNREETGTFAVPKPKGSARADGIYRPCDKLDPTFVRGAGHARGARVAIDRILDQESNSDVVAVLVIGNQPVLGWLSDEYLRRRPPLRWFLWHARPVPIDKAEVACLKLSATRSGPWSFLSSWKDRNLDTSEETRSSRRRWQGTIAWTIHPDDSKAVADVRDSGNYGVRRHQVVRI